MDSDDSGDDSRNNLIIFPGVFQPINQDADEAHFPGLDELAAAAEIYQENQRRIRERMAQRQNEDNYETAKNFALGLHSDQNPVTIQRNEEEKEEKVEGDRKSRFQEAMEAIKMRSNSFSTTEIKLNPMRQREAPKLVDLSLKVLADNSEAIMSLDLVPDHLKNKLSNQVNILGKLNTRFIQLLFQDSPGEISVNNCVDLDEKDLTKFLCDLEDEDKVALEVLNLNLIGRALTENVINKFLERSPKGLPSLTRISLQGAFCLTDKGLDLILRSPLLRFINLSDCTLLTSLAVMILADNFGSTLTGLNIGGCQGIKPDKVFKHNLKKFKNLKYLSVAGLEGINDVVITFLTFRGSNLTGLSLAFCNNVTKEVIWTIGRYCPKLETLDISGLDNLTDTSLESITEGCRSLNSLKLTRTRFSDEAVAAFLEVSGGSLNQLCLNNVRDVGQNTAISLAKVCRKLRFLDLSWCRKLTELELRQILSSCSSLRSLKLFGWTHVNDEFLEELSRSHVHITGLKMTSFLARLDVSYETIDAHFL